jgi:RNA polymerase sigma-70 factor, ECF subfamily
VISAHRFEELRPYLFSIAYRMLGSATEAEDVIQDTWLRTDKAPEEVQSDRAWLSTVVTRLCLDRLKSAQVAREEYVGPWLPEPVLADALPAPESEVLRRESITVAFLVLLETLSPSERAAFLLREVFDYEYAEVARILKATEAAVRQLVHRAKQRLAQGKRRFQAKPERQSEVVSRFLAAAREGDLAGLEALLARDATHTADGGGKVAAARRVVEGAPAIARLFASLYRTAAAAPDRWRAELSEINGEPAMLAYFDGRLDTVFIFSVDEDCVIATHAVRNPDKLTWLAGRQAARPPELMTEKM